MYELNINNVAHTLAVLSPTPSRLALPVFLSLSLLLFPSKLLNFERYHHVYVSF